MKDIVDALNLRIKSPVFGYYILFSCFINWKVLFQLFVSSQEVTERIKYFEANTSEYTLIVIPIIFAIFYSLVYPWVNYLFSYLTSKPFEMKQTLQTIIEHNVLVKKQELEKARYELSNIRERDLIEKTKRDAEVSNIEDDTLRENLENKIGELRRQTEESSNKNETDSLSKSYIEMAKLYERSGNIQVAEQYMEKAIKIEEKKHLNK